MDDRTVIINVECSEPEGKVVRSVRLAHLSIERMQFLWEKLKNFDTIFNDFVKDDYAAFVNHFIMEYNGEPVPTGLLWDVDDIGIFFLQDIIPFQSATAHFVFWDQRFRGREDLCVEMLRYLFREYKFQRIQVDVPLYAYHTLEAVEKLGFVLEGRLRKAVLYHDDWFDVNIYAVLPEDIEGEIQRKAIKRKHICFKCGYEFSRRVKEIKSREARKKIRKRNITQYEKRERQDGTA